MGGEHTFFDQIVFSGGGTRCLWQGGFIEALRGEIPLEPARIAGLSGGALTCCGFLTRRGKRVRDIMCETFAAHDRNIPLHEPFDEIAGHSPHQRMYREIVTDSIGDPQARDMIAEGARTQILIARPPSHDWSKLTGAAMTLVYEADTMIRSNPHLEWPGNFGLTGELVDANRAAREEKIVDLVCAAATIPPAFEPPMWDGKPAVDAGMVDQAPFPVPDRGRTLILLTKTFRDIPDHPDRVYVMPSEGVEADKIDFTDPDKLLATWTQGEKDARRFLASGRMSE